MKKKQQWLKLLLTIAVVAFLFVGYSKGWFGGDEVIDEPGYSQEQGSEEGSGEEGSSQEESTQEQTTETDRIQKDSRYTKPEDVAAYLRKYGKLPENFLTKKEAQSLGWVSKEGNLWEVTDEMSIGGDRFGNNEGLLPDAKGRKWYECDVNYYGGYRGDERIVYSNDGLIYYTDDHYESFTKME